MIEVGLFCATTRLVACLTLISGCVFVCLFARAGAEVSVVCGFSGPKYTSPMQTRDGLAEPTGLPEELRAFTWCYRPLNSAEKGMCCQIEVFHFTQRMAYKH